MLNSNLVSPINSTFAADITFNRVSSPLPMTLQIPPSARALDNGNSTELPSTISPVNQQHIAQQAQSRSLDKEASDQETNIRPPTPFFSNVQRLNSSGLTDNPTTINISQEKPNGVKGVPEKRMRSDGTMYVKGFRLDTVASLGGRIVQGVIPRECFEMGGWIQADHDTVEIPRVPDELWRTLVADRSADGKNPPPWYHRACQITLAQSTVSGDVDVPKLIETGKPTIMVDFLKRVLCVIWNRRFLRSEGKAFDAAEGTMKNRKLFGLAPERAKVNDIICILLGCSVPVILREQRTPIDHYFQFIGEAYIYGMMDGEALAGRDRERLEESSEEFKLR